MKGKAQFTSKSDEWRTPPALYRQLKQEFDFNLDAAATTENTMCGTFIPPEINALNGPWLTSGPAPRVWLNPPYSQVGKFMRKALMESIEHGILVVCLVPARTDTQWWRRWVLHADEIRFIIGRLTFSGAASNAPFPSAIIIFRGDSPTPPKTTWMLRP